MTYETREALGQVAVLMDSIISACLYCGKIYRVVPAEGAPPGVSSGYCSTDCTP